MALRKPKKPVNLGVKFPGTGQASAHPTQATMGPKPPMKPATAPVGQNPAAAMPPPKSAGSQRMPATAPGTNTSPPPMVGTPLSVVTAPAGGPPAEDVAAGVGGPTLDEAGYPLTPGSAASRADADQQWGDAQAQYGNAVYRAALQYGDPSVLAQYSQYGPTVENPNGDLATIDRTAGEQRVNANNSLNNQNLFFSGTNQKAQGAISEGVSRQRADAWQRFVDARDRLNSILAGARGSRDSVYRQTGAADIDADLAKPPEPVGEAPGDASPKAYNLDTSVTYDRGKKKSPRAKGGKVQPRSGSRKRAPRKKGRK